MPPVIETHDLTKCFGKVIAVDNVSLQVERGEIYAFLELNGAGKTTTIRLLLGMIRPTSGEVQVLGRPIRLGEKKPWQSVGYLVETADAYPELSVRENLEAMRCLHPGVDKISVGRVIEQLGLQAHADRRTATLSHGNKQRLGLAKALLHHPELILLDGPANGLDPAGIVEIRDLQINLAHQQGVTVFMSSHILGEISRIADRIGIIHQGHLLLKLSIAELNRNRRRKLLIRTRNLSAVQKLLVKAELSGKLRIDKCLELTGEQAIIWWEMADQVH